MNSIPIVSPSELHHYLTLARATNRPLFLRGGPGVGKSSIFRDFAKAQGPSFGYFDDRALYRDPTALHMPAVDLAAGLTRWLWDKVEGFSAWAEEMKALVSSINSPY